MYAPILLPSSCQDPDVQRDGDNALDEGHCPALQSRGGPGSNSQMDEG